MNGRDLKDRYINPYTDFGFKKLFGTEINKELLISFINSLLHGKEVITNLTYLNTEHLGTSEADRKAVFDVYCENEKGEKILVEMQRGLQQYFKDRSIYYATFPIREQAQRGDWDYQLKGIYIIGILNFTFDEKDDNYFHHEVQLLDNHTKEVFYDKLTFIYLEMPKFNKTEDELHTMFEKWLFVLRNLSRLMERPKALQERVFTRLFEAAEIAKFTKVEYEAYEDSLKAYRDWKNMIDTAMMIAKKEGHEEGRQEGREIGRKEGLKEGLKEGREEGLKEGREEGLKEKAIETARRMKTKGYPIEEIMLLTDLSEEEITQLL
ncbi:MAG: Rpn family recombination-promoting nuclease/putative transposase [Bacteroides sp.]|nr:Rpn family recombination-promoting nuclease/putative transposase [Bacteroides sp.]